MPDGSSVSISAESELSKLRNWYYQNPGITERPIIIFPIKVIKKHETIVIETATDLQSIYFMCESEDFCFRFVYPVVYTMPDGSLIPVESEGSDGEFNRWYAENPGITEKPVIKYPISIVYKDGNTVVVSNQAEFNKAVDGCP